MFQYKVDLLFMYCFLSSNKSCLVYDILVDFSLSASYAGEMERL